MYSFLTFDVNVLQFACLKMYRYVAAPVEMNEINAKGDGHRK